MKPGDILLTYDGQEIKCARRFANLVRLVGAGDKPKELRILRDGQPLTLPVRATFLSWQEHLETRAAPGRDCSVPARPIQGYGTRSMVNAAENLASICSNGSADPEVVSKET